MEADREIELQILVKISEGGNMIEKDYNKLASDNGFENNMVFKRIINFHPALISAFSQHGIAGEEKCYQISEYGELRRKILQREKNDEMAAWTLRSGLVKHSSIVRDSTKILLIISLLTLLAAMHLIHLESCSLHFKGD